MAERTALLFAYDGAAFDGYARQADPGLRTVEGRLLARLVEVGVIRDVAAARFRSGSRTDRGVSALANVAAFDSDLPPDRVAAALGTGEDGLFPLASTAVDGTFDPRRAAAREYRFFLDAAQLPAQGDAARLEAALRPFVGTHDFTAFCRLEEGRSPMRTVEAIRAQAVGDLVEVQVVGPSFLWNQVRRMVAAGLAVLRGEATVAELTAWLAQPSAARDLGLAPAEGLVLWSVRYPGLRFQVDRALRERLVVLLAQRATALAVRTRAVRALRERLADGDVA